MQRSKHKQKSSRPWSEPKWHDQYQQYYQEREGRNGLEYQWIGASLPNVPNQSIPRSDHAVDELAEGVRNLAVDQNSYDPGQSFEYGTHHAAVPTAYTHDASQPQDSSGYLGDLQAQQQSDKGKGKSLKTEQVDGYGDSSLNGITPQAVNGLQLSPDGYDQGTQQQYPDSVYLSAESATSNSTVHAAEPHGSSYDTEETQNAEDVAYNEAIRRSHNDYYGTSKAGEPSYSANAADVATSSWSGTVDPNAYELNPPPTNPEDAPTPRGGSPVQTIFSPAASYIQGTPGDAEMLDSRYRVEHSSKFQPGEVFKILWSEPLGQVGQAGPDDPISDVTRRRNAAGNKFYIGFRRFIIVTTDESHHSTCVPILTYDRRGCLKKGVRPNKHGIIYMAGHKPRPLKNEPELGFDPVALQVYAEGETLARESRVNYSKLVTIEHNVKVFFIGSIAGRDFDQVRYAVNECWNKKMHRSSRKPRR